MLELVHVDGPYETSHQVILLHNLPNPIPPPLINSNNSYPGYPLSISRLGWSHRAPGIEVTAYAFFFLHSIYCMHIYTRMLS